jgi:hypothetical protein
MRRSKVQAKQRGRNASAVLPAVARQWQCPTAGCTAKQSEPEHSRNALNFSNI